MSGPYGMDSCLRMRGGEEPAEVPVAATALDQKRDVSAAFQRHLGTCDRPHAEGLRRVRELEGAVEAVVVGERECLISKLGRASRQFLGL